jgi:hypothetical protein
MDEFFFQKISEQEIEMKRNRTKINFFGYCKNKWKQKNLFSF